MSPELLSALASVGTFIVITTTAIAAIIQLRHMRASNQITALNEFREEFESPRTSEARDLLPALAAKLEDPRCRAEALASQPPEWVTRTFLVGRLFETLGGYVKHGIVDANVVFDLWSPPIVSAWERLAPLIVLLRRKSGPALCENFEMLAALAKRWMKNHPSAYPRNVERIAPPDRWAEEDANQGRPPSG